MFINWTCLFNWRDTVGSSMLNMTRICALIWHQTKLLTTRRSAACWMIFRTSLSWQRGRQNKTIDETILDGAYIDIYTELCIYIYVWNMCIHTLLLEKMDSMWSCGALSCLSAPFFSFWHNIHSLRASEPSRHDTKFALSFQCLRRFLCVRVTFLSDSKSWFWHAVFCLSASDF